MSPGSHESSSLGRGRSLAVPAFSTDDGAPDEAVRALVGDAGRESAAVARALRGARLLTSVVAVADERDEDGSDASSHMAVVSMVNERGERGLLAFTGVDSLVAWNPVARPVPAAGRDVARAALEDGAMAVVIDVVGPSRRVLTGLDLLILADSLEAAAVAAVRQALAGLSAEGLVEVVVQDVREESLDVDVLVTLAVRSRSGRGDVNLAETAARAASVLAHRRDIQRLVPGGIGVTAV